jgi:DNA-directed RNA polymerase specialized sigma24 family protein
MTMLPWKRTDRQCETQTPAFEELGLPLLPSLHNVALWLSRGATFEAEDLLQETILKALRGFVQSTDKLQR